MALDAEIDKRRDNYLQDMYQIHNFQQNQSNLMLKMSSSYMTFFSWMLEQWKRGITDMNHTYEQVQSRIQTLFKNDPTYQDIQQLLDRYEKFLHAYEVHLPLEFTLSVNPRKEWKEFMAKQQPEECIRLMKNELKSLELIEALKPSLAIWNRELEQYDVERVHRMVQNRNRIRKRIEDAVELETKQTCQAKWRELNERIYKMGVGLQQEAYQKFDSYAQQYNNSHSMLLHKNEEINRQIASYEARLSLVDKPWANWLEKRKMIIKDWAYSNYWALSIASLLQMRDVLVDFKRYMETHV